MAKKGILLKEEVGFKPIAPVAKPKVIKTTPVKTGFRNTKNK